MPERPKRDLRSILARLNSVQFSSYWLIAVLVIMLGTLYGMRMYEVRAALLQPARAGVVIALIFPIAMTCRSYWLLHRRTPPTVWRDHRSGVGGVHLGIVLGLGIVLAAVLLEVWTLPRGRRSDLRLLIPFGLIFATVSLFGLRGCLHRLHFHSNRALNRCVKCDYELSGAVGRKCPECGTMNPTPSETADTE